GVADFERLGDRLGVRRERVKALERGSEGGAVVLEAFARPGEQQLQIGAGFRVQRRQEFVEVDVRSRLRRGQRFAALQAPGRGRAGIDLHGYVLQLRLRAQQ